ncbi:MAG: hypothetical protein Q7R41_06315 [Phycisphaerales bacterium]|nr:hypothetical protein [Phycisphaerales bacterium]
MPKRQPDLRKLARRQRWLIWLVALSLLSQVLLRLPLGQFAFVMRWIVIVVQLLITLLIVVGVVRALISQGNHPVIIVLSGVLMLAPCANLFVLLFVNRSVTRTLRRAGVRVGFWGAKPEDVERALNPMLCRACGYDLTGNVSGRCPECGAEVPEPRCKYLIETDG